MLAYPLTEYILPMRWTAGWGTVWGQWWGCSTLNCGGPGEQPKGRLPLEKMTQTYNKTITSFWARQLVSVQPDVPVLRFTYLCCVVILATLISVLHFILTCKRNMLVKFPRTTPHGLCFLASAAVRQKTVTLKYCRTPKSLYRRLCIVVYSNKNRPSC